QCTGGVRCVRSRQLLAAVRIFRLAEPKWASKVAAKNPRRRAQKGGQPESANSRPRAISPLVPRQPRFADLTKHVENELVRFLNSRGRIAFHDKIDIGNASGDSAIPSQKCDCF